MTNLFRHLSHHLQSTVIISSDECPYYAPIVKRHFPQATYMQYRGKKGCVSGQGELKKVRFDPIFAINHTFAMLRANINRLFRRTWNTTKKIAALEDHLSIYAYMHNHHRTPIMNAFAG